LATLLDTPLPVFCNFPLGLRPAKAHENHLEVRSQRLGAARSNLPPLPEGQLSYATFTQSGGQRRSQNQRKHLRDRVSPLSPAPGTQSSHRSHRPSTVSTDLVNPAPRSPLRRTGPSGHNRGLLSQAAVIRCGRGDFAPYEEIEIALLGDDKEGTMYRALTRREEGCDVSPNGSTDMTSAVDG
jgi:hypothetical protein